MTAAVQTAARPVMLPAWAPHPRRAPVRVVPRLLPADQLAALPFAQPATWMPFAACAFIPVEVFFPGPTDGDGREARGVCTACPVRAQCREYATAERIPDGIWGGEGAGRRIRQWQRRAAVSESTVRSLDEVSERVRSVVIATRQGMGAREIAARLGVSSRTVTRTRERARGWGLLPNPARV